MQQNIAKDLIYTLIKSKEEFQNYYFDCLNLTHFSTVEPKFAPKTE